MAKSLCHDRLHSTLPHHCRPRRPRDRLFQERRRRDRVVGYLFGPAGAAAHPAIVLLHGRGGPYSLNANRDCTLVARNTASPCNANTLSKRHAMWGEFWASRGVLALLPDSFGPRGEGHGFGRFSHDDPERDNVNERTVRPLDAEGALAWLRTRQDVDANRVFLQGWSNGGSTTLNVMIRQGAKRASAPRSPSIPAAARVRASKNTIRTSAPITMFLGSADEEVNPDYCEKVAERSLAAGTKIDVIMYPGATHDFDDPGETRQGVRGNVTAKADAMAKAAKVVQGP